MQLYRLCVVAVQEVQEEGKYAIDSPGNPALAEVSPEEYTLGTLVLLLKIKIHHTYLHRYYYDYDSIINFLWVHIVEENEERTMVEPKSYSDPKLLELMNILIDWVNDVLADHRIIVKNLEQDLYDGQVLQKLYGK